MPSLALAFLNDTTPRVAAASDAQSEKRKASHRRQSRARRATQRRRRRFPFCRLLRRLAPSQPSLAAISTAFVASDAVAGDELPRHASLAPRMARTAMWL